MRKARLALGVWIAWVSGTLVQLIVPSLPVGLAGMIVITLIASLIGMVIALAIAGSFE